MADLTLFCYLYVPGDGLGGLIKDLVSRPGVLGLAEAETKDLKTNRVLI